MARDARPAGGGARRPARSRETFPRLVCLRAGLAIGTGRVAAPADIAEAHAFLRERLMALGVPAEEVVILYGGSVKADNAQGVFAVPGCDGALVGAASRVVEEFIAIVAAAGSAVARG